jgi:serine/threonine protein phosphatase PrpC
MQITGEDILPHQTPKSRLFSDPALLNTETITLQEEVAPPVVAASSWLDYLGYAGILLLIAVLAVWFFKKKFQYTPAYKAQQSMVRDNIPLQIGNVHHIGKRESQQDSFGISDISNKDLCARKGVLSVVADGVGGLIGGAEISALITSYILNSFAKLSDETDLARQLSSLLSEAHQKARKYLAQNSGQVSGSTIVATIIKDNFLYFASVGDSRICLLRDNILIQLNREHNYATQLDEKAVKGAISFAKSKGDPQRGALTSYVGMDGPLQLDRNLKPIPLTRNDRVLLMTDGIFDTLSDVEILATVSLPDVYEAQTRLEEAVIAKQKHKQDNFTAVILQII